MKTINHLLWPMLVLSLSGAVANELPLADTEYDSTTLSAPSSPGVNQRRETVSFVTPLSGAYVNSRLAREHTSVSDSYWRRVTGKELNHGVDLDISQGGSLIRLAARVDSSSGALVQADSIAPEDIVLELPGSKQPLRELIQSRVDSQALATAGLADNSSALLMSSKTPPGIYKLKVSRTLKGDAQYLLNVKEKGSPYQLSLTTPTSVPRDSAVNFRFELSGAHQPLKPTAFIRQPDGTEYPVTLSSRGKNWQAKLDPPAAADIQPGLTELHLQLQTRINGQAVSRDVKSAFKSYEHSARLSADGKTHWQGDLPQSVNFTLELADEGRFQIGAVLTGMSQDGKEHQILRTEVAAWLSPETPQLTLPLDIELIRQSGLKPPFRLRQLELKDQGQMARLSSGDTLVLQR